ncbi:MAG: NAD-dependent epimerase/dehydratase family protein [Verrucomicrobia bacterium]|nr:NAD-dependent epimerase/dehydratase family protein [Verrucomicrobiota bacterium]
MNLKGRHYLVTGGTGFIGAGLVKGLLAAGARVRSLDNDSRGSKDKLGAAAKDVELVVGDIRDAETVAGALKGVDGVCHLAYVNGTEFFYTKPELILEVAVKGMMNVIDGCRLHGVRELVLASSSEVYQTPPKVPTDESAPLLVPDVLNPRFSYGGGKIICELLAVNYGRNHFDRALIFRPHNVYGPDMGWEHVVPQFALRMRELHRQQPQGALKFPIQGTGRETRSFIFIEDMIDGVLKVMERGEHLGIYHIGSGVEISVEELAREVGRCFGRDIAVAPGSLQAGSTLRRCPDITRLRALGFAPRVPLSEGLKPTVRWYDENAHRQLKK